MGATPTYLLPYPELTDPADVPLDTKELADRIEAILAPGTANGQVPVWDNAAKKWAAKAPPGTELAYAEKTASTTLTGVTTEAGAATVVAAPSITLDGATPVIIEIFAPTGQVAGAAGSAIVSQIWEQSPTSWSYGHAAYISTGTATAVSAPIYGQRRILPAAGPHVYAFKAYQQGANATVIQGGAGGPAQYSPAWIRVTKA